MANILPEAKTQFVDDNGKPYAGGFVYFYIPSTTTPKNTWQDAAQTILNPNPIVLDGAGRAVIFGSGAYRQQLYDSSMNLIWDQLTYSPVGASDLSGTGVPGGAGLIGFDGNTLDQQFKSRVDRVVDSVSQLRALAKTTYTRVHVTGYYAAGDGGGGFYWYDPTDTTSADNSGTIIVAADGGRWKLQLTGPVSFKQFGAKFDGATDDTSAINAALSGAGPGIIYAHPGTSITQGGHTLATGQYILGAGKNVSIFSNSNLTSDTFKITNSFCGISDVTLTGATNRTAGTSVNTIGAPSHTYLTRLSIFNFADAGIKMNGVVQYIQDLDISKPTISTGSGILISGGNDQYIRGITFDGRIGGVGPTQCFAGFQATQSGGVWLHDSDFIHAQNGVLLNAANSVVQFMFFDNVACDTCSNNGWNIATSGTGTINDCAFTGCWGASATNSGLLVTGVANSINGLTFSNSRFIGNGTDGVYLQSGCLNVTFTGGLISGNSLTTPLASSGIHLGANLSDVMISGMRIGPSGSTSDIQLNQILVDAGTGNRISVTGCDLQTANTPMTFGATGANNTVSGCTGITLKGRVSATTDGSGHITVTHNNGFVAGSVLITMQNDGAAVFAQWSGASTTTNFQVKFYSSTGVALATTAVTFSWQIDF